MSKVICLLLVALASAAYASRIPNGIHPLSDEMINKINELGTSWKAGRNFAQNQLHFVKKLLGVRKDLLAPHLPKVTHSDVGAIPDAFDARTAWPDCKTIGQIRDQGSCGSCWAFGAVEAMSDRYCVASKGQVQVQISAEDLVSCCGLLECFSFGCNGGQPRQAWNFWVSKGLVSGGLFNSSVGCRPYSVPSCAHHTEAPDLPPCGDIVDTPACDKNCVTGFDKAYKEDKYFGSKAYTLDSKVEQIQAEIQKNGPVEADFTVYADFPNYKSGVYVRESDEQLGGHAIKLLGWGEENGVKYWLAANSWNPYWGDKGFFKIRRGTNECGIEDDVVAGTPKVFPHEG